MAMVAEPNKKKAKMIQQIKLDLPLKLTDAAEYRKRHINLQLDHDEAEACKMLLAGLDAESARLASGRRVQNGVDVVRYLLQQIYQQYQVV